MHAARRESSSHVAPRLGQFGDANGHREYAHRPALFRGASDVSFEFSSAEPHDQGFLDTGDGNRVYFEVRGNPAGKPALIVHGGPGAGSPTGTPRAFDPRRFRIILFDQRGCGRSTPHASDPATDMSLNTTVHLLADMEQLREHLGAVRWLVFGGSWGAALALAYTERHPERVSELVVASVSLASRAEGDWLYRGGVGCLFPEEWERFCQAVPVLRRSDDVVADYARLAGDHDPQVRAKAALAWAAWEDAVLSLEPNGTPRRFTDRPIDDLVALVRICATYAAHAAWLEDGALLRGAARLATIPGVIIHGRLDLSCPLVNPWRLAQAWPGAELVVVDDAGHRGSPAANAALYAALDRYSQD